MSKKTSSSDSSGFDGETIAAKIPLGEMIVDEYQGRVNQGLVSRIAKGWDDSAAGAIILNMRDDGTYAVLDGQHRVLAARQAGKWELNAMVFVGKTKAEEAKLFVQLNTKHNVRTYDRFRANLYAGGVREKTITHILQELGLEISNQPHKKNSVRCVAELIRIYEDFGAVMLKQVAGVLQAAFKEYDDSTSAYGFTAFAGTTSFFNRYPEAVVERVIERMSTVAPKTILGMAEVRKERGQDASMGWGMAITNLYNTGYRVTSPKYLPTERWQKAKYSPRGKQIMSVNARKQVATGIGKRTQFTRRSTEDHRQELPVAAKTIR